MTSTEQALLKFISEDILNLGSSSKLTTDHALVESGILDSLGLMRLVTFFEEEFDIELDEDHLNPENFQSVSTIASLIESIRADDGVTAGGS